MFDGLLRFQISEKWANLWFPLNIQKQKVFQLLGGFDPPDSLTRGSAPGPRWGLRLQTPVIGSRSSKAPLCQILNTPLLTNDYIAYMRRLICLQKDVYAVVLTAPQAELRVLFVHMPVCPSVPHELGKGTECLKLLGTFPLDKSNR